MGVIENVADLMTKHLAAARVEEDLPQRAHRPRGGDEPVFRGHAATAVGVVVTPPLESARGLCRSARVSVGTPSQSSLSVQPDEG